MRLARLLLIALLLIATATDSLSQATLTGPQRRQERRTLRRADRHNPARWDRMPLWSAGFGVSSGYGGGEPKASSDLSDSECGAAWRLEGSRRIRKGWYLMAQLERNTLHGAGLVNAHVVQSPDWFSFFFFFGSSTTYNGDLITLEHHVNTLALTTGLFSAPFPRRHGVGLTLAMAGGLGLHAVEANFGVQRNVTCTVSENLWSSGTSNDALSYWSTREVFAQRTAFGLSLLLQFRAELWLGRHVSILVPSMDLVMPMVQPHFQGRTDPSGTCDVRSYDLDLTSVRFGTGLSVHF